MYGVASHGAWCHARTIPMRCRYCGQPIFYFSCDHGSKVLFNELGGSWPEHRCIGYLVSTYGKKFVERGMEWQLKTPAGGIAGKTIHRQHRQTVVRNSRIKKRLTVAVEPLDGKSVSDMGVVKEVIIGRDHAARIGLRPETLGASMFEDQAGQEPVQLTVHVGDLEERDAKSYTFLVPKTLYHPKLCQREELVSFALQGFAFGGIRPVWIAKTLLRPE